MIIITTLMIMIINNFRHVDNNHCKFEALKCDLDKVAASFKVCVEDIVGRSKWIFCLLDGQYTPMASRDISTNGACFPG